MRIRNTNMSVSHFKYYYSEICVHTHTHTHTFMSKYNKTISFQICAFPLQNAMRKCLTGSWRLIKSKISLFFLSYGEHPNDKHTHTYCIEYDHISEFYFVYVSLMYVCVCGEIENNNIKLTLIKYYYVYTVWVCVCVNAIYTDIIFLQI